MSDGKRFRFTPKRRKVQCSKCDEILDNDYALRHITKHHPALITAGNALSVKLIKESSQPSVSSFFKKSQPETSFCDEQLTSRNEANTEENMMDAIIDEFASKNDGRAHLLCHI